MTHQMTYETLKNVIPLALKDTGDVFVYYHREKQGKFIGQKVFHNTIIWYTYA